MIYFDNSASTPLANEVIDAVTSYMKTSFANPSSRHTLGLEAERIVENARISVSKALGADSGEIYFTSGGTESDNIALFGSANLKKGKRIVTTAIEHPAVLSAVDFLFQNGFEVIKVNPDKQGNISEEDILKHVNNETCLVTVMHVNNETGAVLPIDKIGSAIKRISPRALFHVDAVQSFGHIPFKPKAWGIDLASISSHKIHGPKGVGALFVKRGITLKPHIFGGGQEKNIRSGTQNVSAIHGFGAACNLINLEDAKKVQEIKDYLKNELLKIPGTILNGSENSSPYILNISFGDIRSEIMLNALSNEKIYVSSASACAGGRKSYVLSAMNAPKPDSAIRFSLSRYNTMDEAHTVAEKIKSIEKDLRR